MRIQGKHLLINLAIVLSLLLPAFMVNGAKTQLQQYYISPTGSDANNGLSPQTPFKTIQHGLDIAQPGAVLNLGRGIYRETLMTKVNGSADAPIIIRGMDNAKSIDNRYQTVLYGTGRIVNIDHSFYQLEGFAIDGQEALRDKLPPTDPSLVTAFKDANKSVIKDSKLIYIGSSDAARELTGIKITNMYLRGAGGECVRIRNAAHHNEISVSVIEYCGMFGKENGDAFTYHNGEGVYIGTSPKSVSQPMAANDTSSYNTVADNIIHTYGSECFEVKENAHHNSFVNNECRYNLEPLKYSGSNIELRGDHNLVEGNVISGSAGWNLKLKSDDPSFDKGGNTIRKNNLTTAAGANIRSEAKSAEFCGNTIDDKSEGVTSREVSKECGIKD